MNYYLLKVSKNLASFSQCLFFLEATQKNFDYFFKLHKFNSYHFETLNYSISSQLFKISLKDLYNS